MASAAAVRHERLAETMDKAEKISPPLQDGPAAMIDALAEKLEAVRVVRGRNVCGTRLSTFLFALARSIGLSPSRGKGSTHEALLAMARSAELSEPERYADVMQRGLWKQMVEASERAPVDLQATVQRDLPALRQGLAQALVPAPESWRRWHQPMQLPMGPAPPIKSAADTAGVPAPPTAPPRGHPMQLKAF